jgi:hypothetical protein
VNDDQGKSRGAAGNSSPETRQFPTLAEYSHATHQDEHSVNLGYDIFVHVPKLDAKDLKTGQRPYRPDERGDLLVAAGEQEDLCLRFAHASGCAKNSCFWQGWPVPKI